jgi:hypothetical protein
MKKPARHVGLRTGEKEAMWRNADPARLTPGLSFDLLVALGIVRSVRSQRDGRTCDVSSLPPLTCRVNLSVKNGE